MLIRKERGISMKKSLASIASMRKATLLCMMLAAVLCYTACVYGEEPIFKISYESFDVKGNHRWDALVEMVPSGEEKDVFRLTEQGMGVFDNYKEPISWVAICEFKNTVDKVMPLWSKKDVFDQDGILIARETQEFDFEKHRVTFQREDIKRKRVLKKVFKFKGDIVNRLILELYIQKMLENGQKRKVVNIISTQPKLHRITARIIKEEEVDFLGEKKSAYKIYLDPNIGLLTVLELVLPEAYTWHLTTPDFEWVQYEGPENAATSPRVEIKMTGMTLKDEEQE
ncbi:hypothetical protein ACFL1E_03260 [Candidatus Omnitrophota bacterium]